MAAAGAGLSTFCAEAAMTKREAARMDLNCILFMLRDKVEVGRWRIKRRKAK